MHSEPLILAVLDLDGTLVDSLRDLSNSTNELIAQLGGAPIASEQVASMVGDGAGVLVRRALEASGLDTKTPGALQQFLEIYDRRLLEHTVAYRGMREALTVASRRATLAVLTNKPEAAAARILRHLQLAEFFATVIGGDGPFPRKPDPGGLRSVMRRYGAGATILVGDSPVDHATAQAAGCAFAYARYGFGAARFGDTVPETNFVLDQPSDLAGVLDRFAAVMSGF